MFPYLQSRPVQFALLTLLWALLCLPNLGDPGLWDVDEGTNSGAALEMYESNNWVVPTFNYELRDDKPALLYWLQMACFAVVGVNEFGARLPSALAALFAILATCELGRRLFNATVGLLAGVILATSVSFAVAAHFANPDALLTLFTLLALAFFWHDYKNPGPFRFLAGGVVTGLAVLAKGPIGAVLPLAVAFLFLLWERQLWRLFQPRQLLACVAFFLTAAPWYVWVAVETKGQWLLRFWNKHHVNRFTAPMENHGGPFYSYLLLLLVGFGLWSIFLWPTFRHAFRKPEQPPPSGQQPWPLRHIPAEVRFLLCWIGFVLAFFSISATKLPNYILPLYPALAILTARMLTDWLSERFAVKNWMMYVGVGLLGATGVAISVGIGLVSGVGEMPFLHGRYMPQLAPLAVVGGIPLLGAAATAWLLRRGQRRGFVLAFAATAMIFLAVLGSWGAPVVSEQRAPRSLVQALPLDHTHREVRIAAYLSPKAGYFQPSLVFYCQRKVEKFPTENNLKKLTAEQDEEVCEFLRGTLPSYLFLSVPQWEHLEASLAGVAAPLRRHRDFHYPWDIVVVGNKAALALGK
jgi:4-amino-4-deoxy-L-arabinose transferase-like glycosyltransferase